MAKLKCDDHRLRVVAVNGKFIHRNGFGTLCDSTFATVGSESYTAEGIKQFGLVRPPRSVK